MTYCSKVFKNEDTSELIQKMPVITIEAVIELLGSLPLLLSSFILYTEYRRFKDRALLHLMIGWLSFGLAFVVDSIALIYNSQFLFAGKTVFLVILALNIEIAISLMITEKVNYIRFAIISFIGVFTIYTAFLPNAIDEIDLAGSPSLGAVGLFRIFFLLTSFWVAIMYGVYAIMLYQNADTKYKSATRNHLFGYLIFGPGAIFTFLFKLNWIIPGLQAILIGVGALITTRQLIKTPQLIYMLPFNAYTLSVIKEGSGLTIFSHNWSMQDYKTNPQLLATVFESISMFANEALKLGSIDEIKFDYGTLLINEIPEHKLYVLLVADRSSYSLRKGLNYFTQLFRDRYQEDEVIVAFDLSKYKFARGFIDLSFPYVPVSD